jgi:hypothetical protein
LDPRCGGARSDGPLALLAACGPRGEGADAAPELDGREADDVVLATLRSDLGRTWGTLRRSEEGELASIFVRQLTAARARYPSIGSGEELELT